MTGFILAAGLGTRLRPITDTIPKALVAVCGKPLLLHTLEKLTQAGVSRIGVNAHHLARQVHDFARVSPVAFTVFEEKEFIRETGGALYFARDFLSQDEEFCVYNGDVLTSAGHGEMCRIFHAHNADCVLFAVVAKPGGGTVNFNAETGDYLGAVAESGIVPGAAQGEFFSVAFYRRRFLELLTPEDRSIKPVWMRAREQGVSVKVAIMPGVHWITIDTPELLQKAQDDCIKGLFEGGRHCD